MTTSRSSRRRKRAPAPSSVHPTANPTGGRLRPLSPTHADRIISTSLDILATVGMAGLSQDLLVKVVAAGATVRTDGRVLFPRSMVEDVISDSAKKVTLPGFLPEHDIAIGCGRVHIGTGVPSRQRPYCFAALCHVVPPPCFAEDACEVLQRCVAMGRPVQLCAAPQAGATSPASLAGTRRVPGRSCTGQRPVARL